MEFYDEKIKALAIEIYELDAEVYKKLGSSLGRVFGGEKDICIRNIMEDLHSRQNSSRIRSELALISNMARTIPDHDTRHDIMVRYNNIVEEIAELPTGFADGDILDPKIADLNTVNLKDRFNDVSVMNEVFRQKDGEEAAQATATFQKKERMGIKKRIKAFKKYHGLSSEDVLFFDTSKFLVEKAKQEDFIVMGRFADAILTINHIPHISIFITAPEKRRIQRFLEINKNVTPNQAKKWIESEDKRHLKTYKFYTGRKWSKASNYDICINSASYGIKGSIELIIRMLQLDDRVKQLIE